METDNISIINKDAKEILFVNNNLDIIKINNQKQKGKKAVFSKENPEKTTRIRSNSKANNPLYGNTSKKINEKIPNIPHMTNKLSIKIQKINNKNINHINRVIDSSQNNFYKHNIKLLNYNNCFLNNDKKPDEPASNSINFQDNINYVQYNTMNYNNSNNTFSTNTNNSVSVSSKNDLKKSENAVIGDNCSNNNANSYKKPYTSQNFNFYKKNKNNILEKTKIKNYSSNNIFSKGEATNLIRNEAESFGNNNILIYSNEVCGIYNSNNSENENEKLISTQEIQSPIVFKNTNNKHIEPEGILNNQIEKNIMNLCKENESTDNIGNNSSGNELKNLDYLKNNFVSNNNLSKDNNIICTQGKTLIEEENNKNLFFSRNNFYNNKNLNNSQQVKTWTSEKKEKTFNKENYNQLLYDKSDTKNSSSRFFDSKKMNVRIFFYFNYTIIHHRKKNSFEYKIFLVT